MAHGCSCQCGILLRYKCKYFLTALVRQISWHINCRIHNIGNEIEEMHSNFVSAMEFLTVSTAHRAASFGKVFTIPPTSLRNTQSPDRQSITGEPFGAQVKSRRIGTGTKLEGLSLRCNNLFARALRARSCSVMTSHADMIRSISKLSATPDRNVRYERSRLLPKLIHD